MKFWLDSSFANLLIVKKILFHKISLIDAKLAYHWGKNGYLILEEFFNANQLDRVWSEYENELTNSDRQIKLKNNLPERQLNPHLFSQSIYKLMDNKKLLSMINFLSGTSNIPFQSISSHRGSEQKAHSDAIHMTTNPLGGLIAVWIAFEDIRGDCGPLEFYPRSHKLPYILSKDIGIDPRDFDQFGYRDYTEIYEPNIEKIIKKNKLKKSTFFAKKGDVLFWHHNLLHGGSKITNPSSTRKSLVFHYFSNDVDCYHDLIDKKADLSSFS